VPRVGLAAVFGFVSEILSEVLGDLADLELLPAVFLPIVFCGPCEVFAPFLSGTFFEAGGRYDFLISGLSEVFSEVFF